MLLIRLSLQLYELVFSSFIVGIRVIACYIGERNYIKETKAN